MRWTIWQRRTTCKECGARLSLPEQGLTVTCEYCGAVAPVPDAEQRRQRMDDEQRRLADEQRRKAELQGEARQQALDRVPGGERARHVGVRPKPAAVTLLAQLIKLVVALAIVAGIVYGSGLWTRLNNLWRGDDGAAGFERLRAALVAQGYTAHRPPKAERYLKPLDLLLPMERGQCYVVAVSRGGDGVQLDLADPHGKALTRVKQAGSRLTLSHCPRLTGVHTARLTLSSLGRLTHGLFFREAPTVNPGKQTRNPSLSKKKKRRPRRRRAVTPKEAGGNKCVTTEGAEAPRRQGARRAQPGGIQPTSNADGVDGSAAQWNINFHQPPKRPRPPKQAEPAVNAAPIVPDEPDDRDLEPDDEQLRRALEDDDLE